MVTLGKLYKPLSTESKRIFLDEVAIGFCIPYQLNNNLSEQTARREYLATQFLIRDYFLYSEDADIKRLRERTCEIVENFYSNTKITTSFDDILEKLYQPENVKLMFEIAIARICMSCGLSHYDTVDKSFKFRNNYRICEQDKKDHVPIKESKNPIIPILSNIVDTIYSETMLDYEKTAYAQY